MRLDKDPEAAPKVYTVDQVKLLKDGRVKIDKKELEQLRPLLADMRDAFHAAEKNSGAQLGKGGQA